VNYREKAFFRAGMGWASGIGSAARAAFVRPSRLGELLFFASLVRHKVPIALLNRSDVGELPSASDWYYRRCHACFVREFSPQPEMTLKSLFSLSGGNPETNRRGRKLLSIVDPRCPTGRDISKLRPISLGMPEDCVSEIPFDQLKEYDVFFAGDLHEKGIRGRLLAELRGLAERRGWKVLLRERLPRGEYLRCLAASRLCLSPPGMGWDCWRHYEAMLAGSVPLMTYPTILQYHPAIEGEHCFHFAPETGGLTRCLEKALASPDRLTLIAFLRLRIPPSIRSPAPVPSPACSATALPGPDLVGPARSDPGRLEVPPLRVFEELDGAGLVRELHVYGSLVPTYQER